MTKINLRITTRAHAHIQTLTKTPAKIQKDLAKIVARRSCVHKILGVRQALVEVKPKNDYVQTAKKRQKLI